MKYLKVIFLSVVMFLTFDSYSFCQEALPQEQLVRVNVINEFDDQIQVQLDKGRKYPIGPNEKITLGEKAPGKYTLTIYNKKGDFVDNLTRNVGKENMGNYKFLLNDRTVSNSNKITGLSTGQKVALTAGAIGAGVLGTALIQMAVQGQDAETYIPQQEYLPPQDQVAIQVPVAPQVTGVYANANNAFAPGGKAFKFLNTRYDEVTLIVEGTDGNPVGNNWTIPKGTLFQKPQPLIFSGKNITILPTQKVSVVTPDGFQLQRFAFELDSDSLDGNYVWIIK